MRKTNETIAKKNGDRSDRSSRAIPYSRPDVRRPTTRSATHELLKNNRTNRLEDQKCPLPSTGPTQRKKSDCEKSESHPKTKKRKVEVDKVFNSLKTMGSNEQLELWKKMINNHPFDLQQLQALLTAIDSRIKLDIVSAVPYEIALYIMSFLSPEDLGRAAQVCRTWRTVCEDNRLWREKCDEENLLGDKETVDVIFRRRIRETHRRQEEFVKECSSSVPFEDYKAAYITHINILRNWRTRSLDIPDLQSWEQDGQQQTSQSQGTDQSSGEQMSRNNRACQTDANGRVPLSPSTSNNNDSNNNMMKNLPNIGSEIKPFAKRYKMRLNCHIENVITCLQYNPKSGLIVSGSDDHTLKVWSSETGRCISTLKGHTGGVWSSQLTEGDIVISGATDRTVRIWKARTAELLHILYGHSSTVRCLAVCDTSVVSGSRDHTLRLWDIVSGECLEIFAGHTQAVRCVEFRDGIIVSGAYDHLVMVWDAGTGECLHTLACHTSRIYSLQFDGKTIASGSLDSTICIWDLDTGKLRHTLTGHTSLTSKMLLRGNLLVSANADSYCKIWDVTTGRCLRTLGENDPANKHASAITSVYFNDEHVVTSSDDGTVKLWNAKNGMCIRNLVTLPMAGGVIWRIRASYTKLVCAVGSRLVSDQTHLLVLDFDE